MEWKHKSSFLVQFILAFAANPAKNSCSVFCAMWILVYYFHLNKTKTKPPLCSFYPALIFSVLPLLLPSSSQFNLCFEFRLSLTAAFFYCVVVFSHSIVSGEKHPFVNSSTVLLLGWLMRGGCKVPEPAGLSRWTSPVSPTAEKAVKIETLTIKSPWSAMTLQRISVE